MHRVVRSTMRSTNHVRVIEPDDASGWPGDAHRGVRRLATALDRWRQENGPATDHCRRVLPLPLGISLVPLHLLRRSILIRKIEPDVGGRIDDLERRVHKADHVQAAESSR